VAVRRLLSGLLFATAMIRIMQSLAGYVTPIFSPAWSVISVFAVSALVYFALYRLGCMCIATFIQTFFPIPNLKKFGKWAGENKFLS
jgi:hypothetical protein